MSEGHLRKVGLLPTKIVVELVDAPLDMGMVTTVNSSPLMRSLFLD